MKSALTHTKARRGWTIALAAVGVLLLLALLPPFLHEGPRAAVMHAFRPVCHQLPDRSFAIDGVPIALCHRCSGIAGGLVLGVLLLPLAWAVVRRHAAHARWVLLGSAVPATLDWVLGVTGLWMNTPLSRVLTGAAFGVVAGCWFAFALAGSAREPEGAAPA